MKHCVIRAIHLMNDDFLLHRHQLSCQVTIRRTQEKHEVLMIRNVFLANISSLKGTFKCKGIKSKPCAIKKLKVTCAMNMTLQIGVPVQVYIQ